MAVLLRCQGRFHFWHGNCVEPQDRRPTWGWLVNWDKFRHLKVMSKGNLFSIIAKELWLNFELCFDTDCHFFRTVYKLFVKWSRQLQIPNLTSEFNFFIQTFLANISLILPLLNAARIVFKMLPSEMKSSQQHKISISPGPPNHNQISNISNTNRML